MDTEKKVCLYCQTPNSSQQENCSHCGMALANKQPNSAKSRINFFVKVFWVIVIFCGLMIYYLPR